MIINRFAVKRQVTVLALLVLIVVVGLYTYLTLPRESNPDITIPYVFVTTHYEGVSAEDMETLVTIPLERKLKGIQDTEEIQSTSFEGVSTVAIEFQPKVDIDDALQKVKDKVDEAKPDLPADLPEDPYVKEVNLQDFPVIRVILSGNFSLRRLKTFAESMEDRFESIPGVLEARIVGGLEREIHVEFDLDRVAAYNMPFSSLVNAVTKSNINMPGGSMDIGRAQYTVRVPEEFEHPSEIFNIVAFMRQGKPVYLRDVANIRDSYKDPQTISRIDGRPSVTVEVIKRSGENIVRVCDEVKAAVESLRPELPPSLNIDVTSDESKSVRLIVRELENNILTGLILVLVVIFAFIGGRSALFVSLAIPYSMFLTFIMLTGLDVSLNMIVLFSLILALGMLVDNGIVIVENIYRHMQQGKSRRQAARDGADEVAWPVITSTLTTVGAFAPLLFWPGIMGEFMKFLPLTLIIALFGSLFVALVINPVLSSLFQTAKPEAAADSGDPAGPGSHNLIFRAYRRLLVWSLSHRALVTAAAVLLLAGSTTAFALFGQGVEFFPETDPDWGVIHIKAPIGTNLEGSDEIVRPVEALAREYHDIRHVITTVGKEGGDPFSGSGSGTHISQMTLDFKDYEDRSRPSIDIIREIRERAGRIIKGAEWQVEKSEEGPPSGAPINLEISGPDMLVLGELAAKIRELIQDIPGLVDLKDNFISGKPEIRVRIDKEKAAYLGLDAYTIAQTIKGAINGLKVGVYREGKEEFDILTRVADKDRHSIESLKRLTISGDQGEPIPVTSVASFELTTGLGGIYRKDQKRVVTISGENAGRLANDIIRDIGVRLSRFDWPRGYQYRLSLIHI